MLHNIKFRYFLSSFINVPKSALFECDAMKLGGWYIAHKACMSATISSINITKRTYPSPTMVILFHTAHPLVISDTDLKSYLSWEICYFNCQMSDVCYVYVWTFGRNAVFVLFTSCTEMNIL